MKRSLALLLPFALVACQDAHQPLISETSAPAAAAFSADPGAEIIPGQYIVVFRDDVSDVRGLAQRLIAENGGEHRFTYTAALRGFAARLPDAAIGALRSHPSVKYIEQDGMARIAATQTGATWGIDRIDQRDRPLSTTYEYNATGAGVTAYIIDTGIRLDHQQFTGRMVGGFDAVTSGGNASDCNGHGTHVAGTVGGTTWGVAKDVKLSPIRVLNCSGSGSWSGVIAGVDWVTANHVKPAVANMSLGGGIATSVDDAVRNSIAAGVTYAIAAGNSTANACNYTPARVAEALTVGSTTSSDGESSFSNFGTCVNILAPGSSITSAYHTSATASSTMSGTSMAAPHVAGAAALYLEKYPSATPAAVGSALTSNASLSKITLSGTSASNGTPNRLLYTMFIEGGSPPPPPPPPPPPTNQDPTASFAYRCFNTSNCTFTDQSTDSDGMVTGWNWAFGGAGTSTQRNPSFNFPAAGTYAVTLTVTDNAGATGTTTRNITCSVRGGTLRCS